jgi:hypothetical protein
LLCITEVIRSLQKRSDVDRLMIACTLYTILLMYLYPWRARPPPLKFFPLREEPEAYCPDDNTITVDCSSVEYFGRVPSLDLKAAMRHSHAAVHDTFSYDRGRGAALVLQACFSRGLFEIQICLRYAANVRFWRTANISSVEPPDVPLKISFRLVGIS